LVCAAFISLILGITKDALEYNQFRIEGA